MVVSSGSVSLGFGVSGFPGDEGGWFGEGLVADVCVMGAGIIGLHNALAYAGRGHRVVVIDQLSERSVGRMKVGESLLGYSSAFLRTVGDMHREVSESFEKLCVCFIEGLEGKEEIDESLSECAVH